jgi:hypothetical protein
MINGVCRSMHLVLVHIAVATVVIEPLLVRLKAGSMN